MTLITQVQGLDPQDQVAVLGFYFEALSGSCCGTNEAVYTNRQPGILLKFGVPRWKSASHLTEVNPASYEFEFIPRTAFGKTLAALRFRAIAQGMPLLSQDEVLTEVKRRRGELEVNEANLH